jgi:hypothetical protein
MIENKIIQPNINQEFDEIERATNELILSWAENTSICSEEKLNKYKKNKKFYLRARSLVIEFHLLFEFYMEQYIANYFVDEIIRFLPNPRYFLFHDLVLRNVKFSFKDKVRMLKKIYKSKNKSFFTMFQTLNTIRNAFSHGYDIEDAKFNFGKKGNFFSRDNAVLLVNECLRILEELVKALERLKSDRENVEQHHLGKANLLGAFYSSTT